MTSNSSWGVKQPISFFTLGLKSQRREGGMVMEVVRGTEGLRWNFKSLVVRDSCRDVFVDQGYEILFTVFGCGGRKGSEGDGVFLS